MIINHEENARLLSAALEARMKGINPFVNVNDNETLEWCGSSEEIKKILDLDDLK